MKTISKIILALALITLAFAQPSGNTLPRNNPTFTGTLTGPIVSTNNVYFGYTTTATAAGTTVLTAASTYQQYFTGSTTQTVTLPVASTMVLGQRYMIVNASSGTVTVNSSGANLVISLTASTQTVVTCILTSGTSAASWSAQLVGAVSSITGTANQITASAATGAVTLSIPTNPTLPGNVTATGNLTFGTAGSILSGTTGSQGLTLTGTNQSWAINPSGTGSVVITTADDNQLSLNGSGQYSTINFQRSGVNKGGVYYNNATPGMVIATTVSNGSVTIMTGTGTTTAARFPASGNTLLGGLLTDDTNATLQVNGPFTGRYFIQNYTTTPHTLTSVQSRYVFTQTGASALNVVNLPAATGTGNEYTFIVTDTDGFQIKAGTGDTIRIQASATASAGNIQSTTIGTTVRIIDIATNQWVSVATNGTWTIN